MFITHSLASSVSKLDLKTGKIMGRMRFSDASEDGSPYGPRTVVYEPETDTLYVGGVGDPGLIWVIDTANNQIQQRWKPAGNDAALLLNLARGERVSQQVFAAP